MDVNVTLNAIRRESIEIESISNTIDMRLDRLNDAGMDSADSREKAVADLEQSLRLSALALAEHVTALDEWIRKDGFLPTEWVGKSL